jgi:hypothetical protein
VKDFLRRAFYDRFGLAPHPLFVEPHPGGGAVGVRLDRSTCCRTMCGGWRPEHFPTGPG